MSTPLPRDWTIGVVHHGAVSPSPTRTRPDLCASLGHPGATYNPWLDASACLCGVRWFDGDHSSHVDCCDGPLMERRLPDGSWPS